MNIQIRRTLDQVSGAAVREHWYFDCEGPAGNQRWVWRRVASDGALLSESERFNYYLDALNDAERHGFTAPALFGKPASVEGRK